MYNRSEQGEKNRIASMPRGKDHWRYKEKCSVRAVHRWINRKYGKANKCEHKNCTGESEWFEWSLLKGKKYERVRKNFWMLCRKCHTIYDMTETRKSNIIKGIKKRYG